MFLILKIVTYAHQSVKWYLVLILTDLIEE